ncbi:MAG: hypothetical protein GX971_04670 [Firmicutes bacterium]|nr:hypothetical protein [Bacillota bacterium]
MRKRTYVITLLLLLLLLTAPSALANQSTTEEVSQERIDLFTASHRMLTQERARPKMKAGMVLTTLGDGSEVGVGVRVETDLGQELPVSILTEAVYLKNEQALAGFLSLKFAPFSNLPYPVYFGGGAGYADGFRYQVFVGVEFNKNLFAEARYVTMPGGIGDRGLHLAAGFQFTY